MLVILKQILFKVVSSVASFAAVADVSTNSYIFFYQSKIPNQLKK